MTAAASARASASECARTAARKTQPTLAVVRDRAEYRATPRTDAGAVRWRAVAHAAAADRVFCGAGAVQRRLSGSIRKQKRDVMDSDQ